MMMLERHMRKRLLLAATFYLLLLKGISIWQGYITGTLLNKTKGALPTLLDGLGE